MAKLSKELRMGIHNRFVIEVIDANTGELKQKAQAFNVICNNWWTKFFTETANEDNGAREIAYGSGTGTPAATDTTLFTYIGLANNNSSYGASETFNVDMVNGIATRILKRVILASDAVGSTITEVGLTDTSSRILTHATLQDMNGNPISIAKTDSDVINLYSMVYLHFNNSYDISVKWFGDAATGQSRDAQMIPTFLKASTWGFTQGTWSSSWDTMSFQIYKNAYGGRTKDVSYETGDTPNASSIVRNYNNKTMTFPKLRADIGYVNMLGVGAIGIGAGYYPDIVIRSGKTLIPPTQITSESVGIGDGSTTKFKTKMDCPYNATVYVNGVQVSGVQVKRKPARVLASPSYYDSDSWEYYTQVYDGTDIPTNNDAKHQYDEIYAGTYLHALRELQINTLRTIDAALKLEGSNDGTTWTTILQTSGDGTHTVSNSTNYKFLRFNTAVREITYSENDGYNIIFTTPPAQGDVITIDYTTDYIPKDSDHVLDVELTLTFGEYQGQ